jgi:hypothetical protein
VIDVDRRKFVAQLFFGTLAFVGTIFLNSCSGENSLITKAQLVDSPPPPPPVPLPQLFIRIVLITPNRRIVKQIYIQKGKSVLSVLKKAFPDAKFAPTNSPNSETTIAGISGHWRYSLNGREPNYYAGKVLLKSDSVIVLKPF